MIGLVWRPRQVKKSNHGESEEECENEAVFLSDVDVIVIIAFDYYC